MSLKIHIEPKRVTGISNPMIYGQFIEHFHRQIYGGIFDPQSKFADENGFRKDVMEAIRNISPKILRWPGGCFVSAYHWKMAVGEKRISHFDKAWRVEDSNLFGTDEFIEYCNRINVEPYICTNAGTGTQEEMSDWVEYCNLPNQGQWAKKRIKHGYTTPHKVKYWSIGNENYGDWEMGAKSEKEWGRYVKEAAKLMKAADPSIELSAASISNIDWNINLLKEAGEYLDWISIHDYWDKAWEDNTLASYEECMVYSTKVGTEIEKTENILGAMGYRGKIKIAFDEWNLRGWHHPIRTSADEDYLTPRDKNDLNKSYTMADAVFSACFLNQCLVHSDSVGMANFAPLVNTRGAIFTHEDGIVLRSTYFVFELFTKYMGDIVIDSWIENPTGFNVKINDEDNFVPSIDVVSTKSGKNRDVQISIVNRSPEQLQDIEIYIGKLEGYKSIRMHSITADSKDSYNDIDKLDEVKIVTTDIHKGRDEKVKLNVFPHSVNIVTFES